MAKKSREEYNSCMIPWIKGKEGMDRRMSFCAGAKICSGKAEDLDEAKEKCSAALAKKLGLQMEPMRFDIDDLLVSIEGKEVIISPELINKLCKCKGND